MPAGHRRGGDLHRPGSSSVQRTSRPSVNEYEAMLSAPSCTSGNLYVQAPKFGTDHGRASETLQRPPPLTIRVQNGEVMGLSQQ
jgi:hypothetical protein